MSISAVEPTVEPTNGEIFVGKAFSLVRDLDGINKICEVIISIFDIIEHFFVYLGETFKHLVLALRSFTDISCFASIVKRIYDFAAPDKDGNHIWDRAWQGFVSLISIAISNVITVINLLASLKLIDICKALSPLAIIGSIFYALGYSLDAWNYGLSIQKNNKQMEKPLKSRQVFTDILNNDCPAAVWLGYTQKKIIVWLNRFNTETAPEKKKLAEAKVEFWKKEFTCDAEKVKKLCADRIKKYDAIINPLLSANRSSWVNLIVDIITVALTILGFLLPFLTGGILLSLLFITTVSNLLDLINYGQDMEIS